jgi:hypothetical protein
MKMQQYFLCALFSNYKIFRTSLNNVKCPIFFFDFKQICSFSTYFWKTSSVKLHDNLVIGSRANACETYGRTDMKMMIGAFRDLYVGAQKSTG